MLHFIATLCIAVVVFALRNLSGRRPEHVNVRPELRSGIVHGELDTSVKLWPRVADSYMCGSTEGAVLEFGPTDRVSVLLESGETASDALQRIIRERREAVSDAKADIIGVIQSVIVDNANMEPGRMVDFTEALAQGDVAKATSYREVSPTLFALIHTVCEANSREMIAVADSLRESEDWPSLTLDVAA